jgi:MarR family transcriptional regulator, transcriptional regulator for hemolysin
LTIEEFEYDVFMRPEQVPIGVVLAATAKAASRSFDDALVAFGGSRPTWLILVTLRQRPSASQRELADVVGIREATITHHLAGMEADGLISRARDPENRRVHRLEITGAGMDAFRRMAVAAMSFDEQLRAGLTTKDIDRLRKILDQLARNVDARAATIATS